MFQFIIKDTGDAGHWVVDLKNENGKVFQGDAAKADCTITIADEDMMAMAAGKLNGAPVTMFR